MSLFNCEILKAETLFLESTSSITFIIEVYEPGANEIVV